MAVIFCSGFDKNIYPTVFVEGGIDRNTEIHTLTKADLPLRLQELVELCEQKAKSEEHQKQTIYHVNEGKDKSQASELLEKQRYVIFNGERSALDSVMKGFKKAYKPAAGSVIYAMLTPTAKTWTLEKYLSELAQEHIEMRTNAQNMIHTTKK